MLGAIVQRQKKRRQTSLPLNHRPLKMFENILTIVTGGVGDVVFLCFQLPMVFSDFVGTLQKHTSVSVWGVCVFFLSRILCFLLSLSLSLSLSMVLRCFLDPSPAHTHI